MRIQGLVVLLVCSGAACGGLVTDRIPGPGATTGETPPPNPPVSTIAYIGANLGPCTGSEYVVIDDCPICIGTSFALCDGTSYSECSCVAPAGWVQVPDGSGGGGGTGGGETGGGGGTAGGGGTDDGGEGSDSEVTFGSEGGTDSKLVPLLAGPNGYVSASLNSVGVTGPWYAYGDGWGTEQFDGGVGAAGERGNCEWIGGFPPSECSTITSPLPPLAPVGDGGPPAGYANGFPPTGPLANQTFCLSGTGAQVITQDGGTSPDYADIYGIALGLDLNNVGGMASAYDAPAWNVVGVQFTVTSSGPFPPLRVEFPTSDTESDGGTNDPYDFTPPGPGIYEVLWTQLETPYPPSVGGNISYEPPAGTTQPRFNPAHLIAIHFHVPTNVTGPVPVKDLCVSRLNAVVRQ